MSTNTILATAPLTATGYHLKATGTALGQSLIWDNGTNVGIGNTNTSYTLDVSGTLRNTTSAYFATASGNVGIGVAASGAKLQVLGYVNDATLGNISIRTTDNLNNTLIISHNTSYADIRSNEGLRFYTGTSHLTLALTLASTGAATFSSTVATNGVVFPASQVSSANANTLDDYEEGTYTVTMTSQTGSITLDTNRNTGSYTKIGNRVLFSFRIDVSSVSSPSGQLNISLPFLVQGASPVTAFRSVASLFVYDAVSTIISSFTNVIIQNTQNVTILIGNTTTGSDAASQMKAGTEFHIQGQYVAA